MGDGVAESPRRQLPVRPVLGQALGHGHGTAHGVVDGGGPREQRVPLLASGRVERPPHRAVRLLPAQYEVDPRLNGRPELAEELDVAGDQVVVPGARGQIGADVGIETGVLDRVALVVVEPAAVGQLAAGQPAVGLDRLVDEPAHGQGHGRLDVVPRVAVPPVEPRDHAVVPLHRGDGVARGEDLGIREDARYLGQGGGDRTDVLGSHAAAPWVGVVGPRRPGTPRGRLGLASGTPDTATAGLVR